MQKQKSFKQLYGDLEKTQSVIAEKQVQEKEIKKEISVSADKILSDSVRKKFKSESGYLDLIKKLQDGSIDIQFVNVSERGEKDE